jgi:hypothetical protein
MCKLLILPLAVICAAVAQPSNWVGSGAAFNQAASPQINGWASYATLLSKPQLLYSFSSYDVTPIRLSGKLTIQTSARTGFAMVIRQLGPITLLGLLDGGMAAAGTGAGQTVGSAFSGGGIAVWKLGKTNWTVAAAYRRLQTTAPQDVFEIGFGRTF